MAAAARVCLLLALLAACEGRQDDVTFDDSWTARRERMVAAQIEPRGVRDPGVLRAMRAVPRHEFVPESRRDEAYEDHPLPIGEGQTISQPYIVAIMAELAGLDGTGRVLEIGTGSGYSAAVLSHLAREVYTIEIVEVLADRAAGTLSRLGYDNVHCLHGDGYAGWPEHAPFDAILLTAAPPRIPEPLKEQLKPGGRLVAPVGEHFQRLQVYTKSADGKFTQEVLFPVRFVPMTGEVEKD